MKGVFTPVESVLNIYDANRLWYRIYGYNGYEVSNDGYVRSMKHYRKYPFGLLIQPVNEANKIYELSDDNNNRVRISITEIIDLANNNPYKNTCGYPRQTCVTDGNPRNDRNFVKREKVQRDPQLDKIWIAPWMKK